MTSLRHLSLAGNEWAAPLDASWANPGASAWAAGLESLDLSDNPLGAGGGGAVTIPAEWLGMKLKKLYVSLGGWALT